MLTRKKASRLRINRVAQGFTLTTLAAASGIDKIRLHRIETQVFPIRETELEILGRILNVAPDNLRG